MIYQFWLLLGCTFGHLQKDASWHDIGQGRLYCYDNVWADSLLNNGFYPGGIFGWFDVFTWEGYAQVQVFITIIYMLRRFIVQGIYATIFVFYYLANSNMVWCFPGETIDLPFFLGDGCKPFGYNIM